jgi:hypothetical protein
MRSATEPHSNTPRFNRGAWLIAIFIVIFLLADIGQVAYRYSLPTDGWSIDTNGTLPVYINNLVGAPSSLQPGDILQAVNGTAFVIANLTDAMNPHSDWQAGKTILLSIERQGQFSRMPDTLVHWTRQAIWRYIIADPGLVVNNLGNLFIFILAGIIFLLKPGLPSARALLVIGTIALSLTIDSIVPSGLGDFFNQPAFIFLNFYGFITWTGLLPTSILIFSLSFPRPKQAIQKRPWLGYIPVAIAIVTGMVFYLSSSLDLIFQLSNIEPIMLYLAAIVALIHSAFTQRDPTSRAQLRWAIWGFVIATCLGLISIFDYTPSNSPVLEILYLASSLPAFVVSLCLSIAVLRFHLFDIDVIIRKTLSYAILTGLLALVYLGCVLLSDSLIAALSGQQHSTVSLVISTLSIAALFNPLRRRIQAVIDRRFFRKKYDLEQTLESFNISIRDQADLDSITMALLVIVRDTLQPEQLGLWLLSPGKDTAEGSEPRPKTEQTSFPIEGLAYRRIL